MKTQQERLAAQSRALADLTARQTDDAVPYLERLHAILATSAETLDVARLSMWCFDMPRLSISCTSMHDRRGSTAPPATLWRLDAPAYFDALDRERVVATSSAQTDPRTHQLADAYLRPLGIGAMLDVPLRRNGVAQGVLCAEHVGGSREWTVDEQNFALSTANLVMAAAADQERRDALDRLAESEARARLIIDTAHDAFISIDEAGLVVGWNAQAERTFGWSCAEVLGRRLADLIVPEQYREAHTRGLQRFLETGEAPVVNQRLELSALDRSGREFPVEITITSPIREGRQYVFAAFLRDISERREHDEQLKRAKEAAEAATRAKSEFLANMSHELRTPLNGVLGYTQLLQRDRALTDGQREALDAIARGGSHLLGLINDVLDLSKIESGRVEIEACDTDLPQMARDVEYMVAETARRKGLTFAITMDRDVPSRVRLDGRHLRQVLINLLGNAVKFTTAGDVRLEIAAAGDRLLRFEVTDTGNGIEPEALDRIFEAFTQTATGAAAGGTGLGLAISRRLVAAMGGAISVDSEPGRGSRFSFVLPYEPAGTASPQPVEFGAAPLFNARLAPGVELTALVADDSSVNRRILGRLLESAGAHVIHACGGVEALALAREHLPDIVFMDLKMPDLHGLEAARRLKSAPETAGIPVVAVSASAFGNTRAAALDAGCADYLPKPVRAESLFAMLKTHLGARFIDARVDTPAADARLDQLADGPAIAARIRAAIDIGDVTGLEALARELTAAGGAEAEAGAQIGRLTAAFDFDALAAMAGAGAGAAP